MNNDKIFTSNTLVGMENSQFLKRFNQHNG